MEIARPVLLYDDACTRCRRFAALVRAIDLGAGVELASLDSPRAEALLPGMSRWDRLLKMRLLTPDGGHFTAADAASELFARLLPTGWIWRPARRFLPAARSLAARAYARAERTRTCDPGLKSP